ncbi:T9SS type A sorting domain-containing protein [Crocinitomicaceae bacterium]|nr:T9SS type A sorting domain-containing protein [Crocinitomicaceae bacterium]
MRTSTSILNDADIYFDFNEPITTNTTVHKIFQGFVEVLNIEDLTIEGKEIFMYPNPTTNLITIQSESVLNNKFKIYDQQGREVMNGKLTGKNTEVSLGKLSRGTYTIQVEGNYKPAVIIKQ